MRLPLFVLFLLALLGAERGAAEEVAGAPPAAIRRGDLERRLRVLASDALGGRETATAGARRAAEYIAAELARAGVEPGAPDGTFFQPYALGRPRLGERNALTATGRAGGVEARLRTDFQPFSMSPPREARGELVFAGYGITAPGRTWLSATGEEFEGWDDYAGLDVRGKIVLVVRKDPGWNDPRHAAFRAKIENAARHGAAGLLLFNDAPTVADGPDELLDVTAPSGLPTASGPLPCAFVTRAFAAALLDTDPAGLAAIETSLCALGPSSRAVPGRSVHLVTDVTRSGALDARNVAGFLAGTDPARRGEVVVVGAHFDHIGTGRFASLARPGERGLVHPGADDNGSGTAALLELAEHFAAPEHRPRRSLLFVAFSGEELGLTGSAHYVRNPLWPLDRTVAMVNLDMVGRLRDDRLHVIGVGTGQGLDALVRAANEDLGFELQTQPSGAAGSDCLPFFRREIPVLFFFTGMHADYHRPSDTVDRIEWGGLERVTLLAGRVVERLANAPTAPAFTAPPAPPRPPVLGVALGPSVDGGVRIGSVTAGGAAEAAGLRAGDVVLRLAGRPVGDGGQLRAILAGLEAGRPVEVVVRREGSTIVGSVAPREPAGREGR